MTVFKDLLQHAPFLFEIPKTHRQDMLVSAQVYISKEMLDEMGDERSLEQLANIATLPGVEEPALAMPDIHQGYGFPIGGVAAIRARDGVISPGGVGYDINCGVRLLLSSSPAEELRPKLERLANKIRDYVPSGVGRGGEVELSNSELDEVLNGGLEWAKREGFALDDDLDAVEESGRFKQADASKVSDKAKERGKDQLGTIGSGNHFVEVQEVLELFNNEIAKIFGLFPGQLAIMIHTGSRGLGHQTCTDYVRLMNQVMPGYGIKLPDRELACAPFASPEGQSYFHAMAAAANFAWVNRQIVTYQIRKAWREVVGAQEAAPLKVLYDVSHNIAKLENYRGENLVVHRKGATRAFGPGRSELSERFQRSGQPVLIPGSMGTLSYILSGTDYAMSHTFGSCCHGAGRRLSRMKAKKSLDYNRLKTELEKYGVIVCAASARGLLEEAPQAYKDVTEVIKVIQQSSIAQVIAKLKPLAVIKG